MKAELGFYGALSDVTEFVSVDRIREGDWIWDHNEWNRVVRIHPLCNEGETNPCVIIIDWGCYEGKISSAHFEVGPSKPLRHMIRKIGGLS